MARACKYGKLKKPIGRRRCKLKPRGRKKRRGTAPAKRRRKAAPANHATAPAESADDMRWNGLGRARRTRRRRRR